jgi:beta-glucanase (GH16 family)
MAPPLPTHRRFLLVLLLATAGATLRAQPAPPAGSLLPGGPAAWRLAWSDEFNYPNARLDAAWESQNGPSGHILCSRWRENVRVTNGSLLLINRKEKRGGQNWTSGSIWTRREFLYGYFECRYKYAAAEGSNNSFWLMTRRSLISKGKRFEIDINEGHYPDEINTNIHNWSDIKVVNGKKTHPSKSKHFSMGQNLAESFHTYGLEWTENELIFYFEGREIRREPNQFCHSLTPIWLSLAIINWAGKVTDALDGTQMEVDYVRYYQRR